MSGATLILILLNDTAAPLTAGQMSVGIGNRGVADLTIGVLSIVGDSEFTIATDPVSNTVLAPGGQRQVVVQLDTTTPGTFAATLRVPSSDPDGELDVSLMGVVLGALVPGMAVDPTGTIDFGSVDTATGSSDRWVIVSSTGTGPLALGTVTLAGAGYTKPVDAVSGTTLPAGGSNGIQLHFDPASDGTKTGTLTIPATGVSSVVINLTGVGTTAAPPPPPPPATVRWYLTRQASPVGAIGPSPTWADATLDADCLLSPTRGGPAVASSSIVNHSGRSGDSERLGRWVSPPLAAQTVDTVVACYAVAYRSSYLAGVVTSALRFGKLLAGGGTTWLPLLQMGSAISPWPDSAGRAVRRFPAGSAWRLTTGIAAGDRLIVELGYRAFSGNVNGCRVLYGGASTGADLIGSETVQDTTLAPWIELVDGLVLA